MPRVKVDYRTGSKESYETFKRVHPEVKVTYKEFDTIIKTYNTLFREYILETGEKVRMPMGFGNFSISKRKTTKYAEKDGKRYIKLPIDWQKSRAAGKRIYNFNYHTEGYRYRWIWFNKSALFVKSALWNFKPSRLTSRALASYLKKPGANYQDIYLSWRY